MKLFDLPWYTDFWYNAKLLNTIFGLKMLPPKSLCWNWQTLWLFIEMGLLEVWQSGKENPHGWVIQALTFQPGEDTSVPGFLFLGIWEYLSTNILSTIKKAFLRHHAVWHFDFQILKTDKKSIVHFFERVPYSTRCSWRWLWTSDPPGTS